MLFFYDDFKIFDILIHRKRGGIQVVIKSLYLPISNTKIMNHNYTLPLWSVGHDDFTRNKSENPGKSVAKTEIKSLHIFFFRLIILQVLSRSFAKKIFEWVGGPNSCLIPVTSDFSNHGRQTPQKAHSLKTFTHQNLVKFLKMASVKVGGKSPVRLSQGTNRA